jgi:hypothetical protein
MASSLRSGNEASEGAYIQNMIARGVG